MKIKGSFKVKDQFGNIISCGQNTITNVGKNLIYEWLSHNNYNRCDNNLFNGKSLSSQSFIYKSEMYYYIDSDYSTTSSTLTSSVNSNLDYCITNFYNNRSGDNYCVLEPNNAICIQFDKTQDISGILFYGYFYQDSYGNFDSNNANPYFTIYTSNKDINYTNQNNSWEKQKNFIMPWSNNLFNIVLQDDGQKISDNYYKNCKVIRFDNPQQVDKIINNIKSVKIVYKPSDTNNDCNFILRGLGLLRSNLYNNPPCVIGLGSNNKNSTNEAKIANVKDVTLNDSDIVKVFINKHEIIQGMIQSNTNILASSSSSSYSSLSISEQEYYQIMYRGRLNRDQFNDKTFRQIGLFFNSGQQINYNDSKDNINKLFSRGIFATQWKKQVGKLVDVQYYITITFNSTIDF